MKRLIAVGLLAISLFGETVFVSPKGKTYHSAKTCMALSRTKEVLTTSDTTAEAHGLHKCGICYRTRKSATKKADNSSWAKENGK